MSFLKTTICLAILINITSACEAAYVETETTGAKQQESNLAQKPAPSMPRFLASIKLEELKSPLSPEEMANRDAQRFIQRNRATAIPAQKQ